MVALKGSEAGGSRAAAGQGLVQEGRLERTGPEFWLGRDREPVAILDSPGPLEMLGAPVGGLTEARAAAA